MIEWKWLGVLAVFLLGGGLFLRLAAKEIRRREKYLVLRLEAEKHEAEIEENRRKLAEEARAKRRRSGAGDDEPSDSKAQTSGGFPLMELAQKATSQTRSR